MFKYRAKNLKGEWVKGSKLEIANSVFIVPDNTKWVKILDRSHIHCDSIVEIDPSTLGVCWGIKDKDVDVFTGDILEDSVDMLQGCCIYKGVVVFSIERSEFCLQVGDSLHPIIQGDYYKLIGNIHDNPEIIEEE